MCCCPTKRAVEMKGSVTDVVCGMLVDPAIAAGVSEYQCKKYFFCEAGCKKSFDAKPVQYV